MFIYKNNRVHVSGLSFVIPDGCILNWMETEVEIEGFSALTPDRKVKFCLLPQIYTGYSKKLNVDDVVCFTGFCHDVAPIFNITDVNVNCSILSETSNLALCEGMSLGIPSVASNCSGNSYTVKNAVNGLLFPVGNADALAESLSRLYRDNELYAKCSVGAYKRYTEEFSAKIMAQKMMAIYKKEYRKAHKSTKSPLPLR